MIHEADAKYNSSRLQHIPTVFMEIGEKGAFVNEVSQDFIGIAGSGEIAFPVKSGRSLTIKQFGEVERG